MEGERLNNLRTVRLLAESATAAVYEAEQSGSPRPLAIKVFKLGLQESADPRALLDELRAISCVLHPNLVEVCDFGVAPDGDPFVVMELLEGESLAARLARVGSLAWPLALEVAQQIAQALEAAHESGVIHRALTPHSVYLARDPHLPEREVVKVLDFGAAKLRPEPYVPAPSAGVLCRALAYLAPEQCRGGSEPVDRRADIYALGAILYESLSGRPPFSSETAGDMMLQHMNAPPPALPADVEGVPAQVERALQQALAKEPRARFASMAAFSAAFGRPLPRISFPAPEVPAAEAVSILPSPLLPPSEELLRSEPMQRSFARSGLWFGLGATSVLLLLLLLGVAGVRRLPERAPAGRSAERIRSARPLALRPGADAGIERPGN